MMRYIMICFLVIAAARPIRAEPAPPIDDWDAAVSDFDKLRTPDSPAFVVLGVSPTEIQRPTTPGTLIATLGGALADSKLGVPKSFAVEFAPYWLFGHPDVPVQDYRDNHLLWPLRTLSLSIGTNQITRNEADATGTIVPHVDSDIGFGARTMLFRSGGDDTCTAAARDEVAKALQGMPLSAPQMAEAAKAGPIGSTAYDDAYKTILETRAGIHNDKCVALAMSPSGLQIDLAGAIDLRLTDSRLKLASTRLAGYAVWANASYDVTRFSAIVMARLSSHDLEMMTERAFDTGARGIFKGKQYVIAAEALVRYRLSDAPEKTTMKADIGFEYELTSDTWISVSLGKDFAFVPGEAASLFSLANLKWGFEKSPTSK